MASAGPVNMQSLGYGPPTTGLPPNSGSMGGPVPVLGQNVALVVTRLLDMPIEENVFGTKRYRIRVLNGHDKEVGVSKPIEGLSSQQARHRDLETVSVPRDRGVLRMKADTHLMFVEVEHVGGLLGGSLIGRCQIHRLDPRSSQVWPYALSDLDDLPASCGIELKVVEEGGPPLPVSYSPAPSMAQVSPRPSMGPFGPPGSMPPGSMHGVMQDISHGVCAMMEFDKVADLPYPRNEQLSDITLSILSDETQKELRKVGPFVATDAVRDPNSPSKPGRLVRADCKGAAAYAQAPVHFGGDAEGGAMYLRIAAAYSCESHPGVTEVIGFTDPIKVSWLPAPTQYYELRARDGKTLGGVYLRHRLLSEAEAAAQHHAGAGSVAGRPPGKRIPNIGAPPEPLLRVSGRTGTFPRGTQEEAYEQASINAEAQNRALLQLCKIADPSTEERNPHVTSVNGYREWDSLDSLFTTMGPNPLAMSEELGPTVARSYQESTSVMKELVGKLPLPKNAADEALNLELIRMMYEKDPRAVQTELRPVVCKSPQEIAATKDMSWCPDPPVYAPLRNMREEDKETLRLACFAPEMNAKLPFADANPNYQIEDDIWGVLADYKKTQSTVVPKPGRRHRVKDDCIMA